MKTPEARRERLAFPRDRAHTTFYGFQLCAEKTSFRLDLRDQFNNITYDLYTRGVDGEGACAREAGGGGGRWKISRTNSNVELESVVKTVRRKVGFGGATVFDYVYR